VAFFIKSILNGESQACTKCWFSDFVNLHRFEHILPMQLASLLHWYGSLLRITPRSAIPLGARIMRLMCRRVLSCLLLATFASGSILGEGLHLLEGQTGRRHHHLHHRGHWIVASAEHERRHLGVTGDHVNQIAKSDRQRATSSTLAFAANNLVFDSQTCCICAFLLQAASPTADSSMQFDSQPLAFAGLTPLRLYSPTEFGSQAPRGPPPVA